MKTQPMTHQAEGLRRLAAAPEYYALGCEQGTGKTWMLLADAEQRDDIDALLVVAPKGVHVNWVLREIPKHLSVPVRAEFWLSGASKKHQARLDKLLEPPEDPALTVLAMNVDAVNTKSGYAFARRFLQRYRAMMVVDESQRIKNLDAMRTKRVLSLGELAVSRRIASGTLVPNSPLDLFGQYEFLRSGLLGTRSYRAFVAEYAELLPPSHRLVQEIMGRSRRGGVPQLVNRDRLGRPIYRNLERLAGLIAPHTYRVLKEDCLELPAKIYQTQYFELAPRQRHLYNRIQSEQRWERADGQLDTFTALTVLNKLRQVTSGFLILDGEAAQLTDHKPRLDALKEIVEDLDGQFIVWASFREELAHVERALRALGVSTVAYHGGVSARAREAAVDAFQNGSARAFVGHPAAGGVGLTLTAATTAIYYSCDFSYEQRAQSEDRCHRIGTRVPVTYIDLVARDTIDERIAAALQNKEAVAETILSLVEAA
jgi:SNF2 family DNA or RNA helicase